MSAIIVLDSSDDESEATTGASNISPTLRTMLTEVSPKPVVNPSSSPELNGYSNILQKRDLTKISVKDSESAPPPKRIKPTLISKTIDRSRFDTESPVITFENEEPEVSAKEIMEEEKSETGEVEADTSAEEVTEENPITPTFAALVEECKKADPSDDMNTLIEKKLLKYYHSVHPDFVSSRGFCKTVRAVSDEIKATPELVYYQLKTVVEELKIRRKSKSAVMSNEEMTSTGNERRDRQIRRLSKGLLIVTKRIAKLEESDVDLGDEDNSTFLQVERFKKHACKIYEQICDLTGESKHAHRSVKKPICFQGTCYPQFNKTIQAFVNRTNTFPDFFDVLRCLEHCNVQYGFGLRADDVKKIAQDAFVKIGKSLQNRRKTDLYETVSHFTGTTSDPAQTDQSLNAKLTENQKYHAKIGTIIDRYAKEQELAAAEHKEKQNTSGGSGNIEDNLLPTNINQAETNSNENVNEVFIVSNEDNCDKEVPRDTNNKENEPLIIQEMEKNKTSVTDIDHVEEIVISDEEDS